MLDDTTDGVIGVRTSVETLTSGAAWRSPCTGPSTVRIYPTRQTTVSMIDHILHHAILVGPRTVPPNARNQNQRRWLSLEEELRMLEGDFTVGQNWGISRWPLTRATSARCQYVRRRGRHSAFALGSVHGTLRNERKGSSPLNDPWRGGVRACWLHYGS